MIRKVRSKKVCLLHPAVGVGVLEITNLQG
jgi:hypothetical protein